MKNMKSAFATILLTAFSVVIFAQQPKLSIERGNTQVSLILTGSVGSVYEVVQATNLTTPVWTPLTNFQLTGLCFTQNIASVTSARFFRARVIGATNMVYISPGSFVMGSPDSEQDRQSFESPQRTVSLTHGFYLAKFEVTQSEYSSVMSTNPSYFVGDVSRPVETISWSDATNYCAKLSVRERDAGRITTNWVYRLPTEAQWEYAARAGTTTRYSFGNDPTYSEIDSYVWHSSNASGTTHPVGIKLPNPWGLYDMSGNVAEYCSDWFATYPPGNVSDPAGPSSGPWHVFRGGNYYTSATYSRSASRQDANAPWNYLGGVGLRVVLVSTSP